METIVGNVMIETIKIFDVIQLRKKYPEFELFWEEEEEYIRNDYGRKYYVTKDYIGWDEKDIYKRLDTLLIELGAERGEWVMMWYSW